MMRPGKMFAEVVTHLFRKPATESYPFGDPEVPEGLRGMIRFIAEKCVGCKLCMKDCPSDAITITKIGDKQFEAVFDLDSCIYCAQCVDSCNKDALFSSSEFALAQLDKARLQVTFRAEKTDNDDAQSPAPAPKSPE